jgi:hypothetical protein
MPNLSPEGRTKLARPYGGIKPTSGFDPARGRWRISGARSVVGHWETAALAKNQQDVDVNTGIRAVHKLLDTRTPEAVDQVRRLMIAPLVRAGILLPILRRQRVYLFAPAGDGHRFARLFGDTLLKVPYRFRRRILCHWHAVAKWAPRGLMIGSPVIVLASDWSGRHGRGLRGDWASVTWLGHKMWFHAGFVQRLPDRLVPHLIAHELGHVHQHASRGICRETTPDGAQIGRDRWGQIWTAGELEDDADQLSLEWGFDPEDLDAWALEAGIARTIHTDLAGAIRRYIRFERTGQR